MVSTISQLRVLFAIIPIFLSFAAAAQAQGKKPTAFPELAPFNSPYLRNYPQGARENAKQGLVFWAYARESYLGFAYNKSKIPPGAVPKNFEGFANPDLKGRLAVGTGGTAPEIVGAMHKV